MPLAPVPDSAYIYILDKGKEISKQQANTILWAQAVKDTLSMKNKINLRLVTG